MSFNKLYNFVFCEKTNLVSIHWHHEMKKRERKEQKFNLLFDLLVLTQTKLYPRENSSRENSL